MSDLHLITIWARFEDGHGYADTPQFVAAFPSSLADAMCELYEEWLKDACDNYRDHVDSPIVGFFEGRASIGRPEWDTLSLVEDDAINPGWDAERLYRVVGERRPGGGISWLGTKTFSDLAAAQDYASGRIDGKPYWNVRVQILSDDEWVDLVPQPEQCDGSGEGR